MTDPGPGAGEAKMINEIKSLPSGISHSDRETEINWNYNFTKCHNLPRSKIDKAKEMTSVKKDCRRRLLSSHKSL